VHVRDLASAKVAFLNMFNYHLNMFKSEHHAD